MPESVTAKLLPIAPAVCASYHDLSCVVLDPDLGAILVLGGLAYLRSPFTPGHRSHQLLLLMGLC